MRHLRWAAETLYVALKQRINPGYRLQPGQTPKRWLILGYAAIGDMIFFLPVIEQLRRRYPNAHITFLTTRTAVSSNFMPATGLVDEISELEVEWDRDTEAGRGEAEKRIFSKEYDGVILTLSAPAHYFARAIADIPLRVGHCSLLLPPASLNFFAKQLWKLKRALITGEFSRRLLLTHKAWILPQTEHAVRRNLRLLEALGLDPELTRPGLPLTPAANQFADKALGPSKGRKRVGIHLGIADNPYFKIWSAERFGRLCAHFQESGMECVFVGGKEEEDSVRLAHKFAGKEFLSLVGKCTLLETFAVISHCDLFLSNDTGLAKAAMALGVPTATLWGPTDTGELGILWDSSLHLDIRTGIACSPCVKNGMPYARQGIDYGDCGHHDCLKLLSEEAVWDALRVKYPELLG